MQTFLPSIDFEQSAKWLDSQRLGKQLVEAMQIYKANFCNGPKPGNPYPYDMWLNYQDALIEYGCTMYTEWRYRYLNGMRGGKLYHKSGREFDELLAIVISNYDYSLSNYYYCIVYPDWLTEEFASNHRSILLGKAWESYNLHSKEYYDYMSQFGFSDNAKRAKIINKRLKQKQVLRWYQSHSWTESPAQRVNDKWPYLWPV